MPAPHATSHLTSVMHVLAPGVLSGGPENFKHSTLAHQTGHYMTSAEGELVASIAFGVIAAFIVIVIAIMIGSALKRS